MKQDDGNEKGSALQGGRLAKICAKTEEQALGELRSSQFGLDAEDAAGRLREYGPNMLSHGKEHSAIIDLLLRFKSPLVIQLLIICVVCALTGDLVSSIIVSIMIMISVLLSFFQERRSSAAAKKLQSMVQISSIVIRSGAKEKVPTSNLVPGDIIELAAGSIIPADMRVLEAKDFFVNESLLTGESMPVQKAADCPREQTETMKLPNACFQGSTVVSGTARALIVDTGLSTYLSAISAEISKPKDETNFDIGVSSFVWLMVRFMVVMVSMVFLLAGLTKGDWMAALLFGLSVAVGLTPEMLPMIITVCLSKGALAMSKKKVIVKKLKAIQNFGAMNMLCTDKTGTLTQDRIVLEKYLDLTSRPSEDVLKYAYMNSHYQTGLRNLLDHSILSHTDLDVEKNCPKIDEIPFDFERKRMSVVVAYEGANVLICKGAVESIFEASANYQVDDEVYPLLDILKDDLYEEYRKLSADGYRILAVAYKEFPKEKTNFSSADEQGLIVLGYLAFYDPPKDSAQAALDALKRSGVGIKVLTGDNELVTRNICGKVGMDSPQVFTGPELAKLDAAAFDAAAATGDIFARLSPMQKEQIVKSLRKAGKVVGFLGDGINDAPALKEADVGISVDTGADVAKESADIILLEQNLMVLHDGIMEGRKVFANIVKYIKMSASSSFGNAFSMVGASYLLPFLPMTPVQILVNNLLYDISQTGIPMDNVDEDVIAKPRSWDISFIRRFMVYIGPISSVFDYATFFLMLYWFNCIAFTAAETSPEMKSYLEQLFQSAWFVESLFTQILIVHIIRTNGVPFLKSSASATLCFTTFAVIGIGILIPYLPVAKPLGFVPLPWMFYPWLALFIVLYVALTQSVKTWFFKKFGV